MIESLSVENGKVRDKEVSESKPNDEASLAVGNGGEKNTQTYEDSSELNGYVITLQKLDSLIREGVADGSIVIEMNDIIIDDDKTFDL